VCAFAVSEDFNGNFSSSAGMQCTSGAFSAQTLFWDLMVPDLGTITINAEATFGLGNLPSVNMFSVLWDNTSG
jgi:hypothetical protein